MPPHHGDYDVWSESSLQDIEYLVRRNCKSAVDGAGVCHEEFLAARQRLLQEWLADCQLHTGGGATCGTSKCEGNGSEEGTIMKGCANQKIGVHPLETSSSAWVSPDSSYNDVGTGTSRNDIMEGVELLVSRERRDNCESRPTRAMSDVEFPQGYEAMNRRSLKSRVARVFRRSNEGLGVINDGSLAPLLTDC